MVTPLNCVAIDFSTSVELRKRLNRLQISPAARRLSGGCPKIRLLTGEGSLQISAMCLLGCLQSFGHIAERCL